MLMRGIAPNLNASFTTGQREPPFDWLAKNTQKNE